MRKRSGEWEEDALYEITMAAAVVTVTASCKIIAAKNVGKLVRHIHSGHTAQRH